MKKGKRRLKRGLKKLLIMVVIIVVAIPVIKLLQRFSAEDEEAYQNCVNKTGDEIYCNRTVFGNY